MASPAPPVTPGRVATALLIGLFALGQVLLWLAYTSGAGKILVGDERTYQLAAQAIMQGGAWHTSSIWPPLQPLFMAALYTVAGMHVVVVQLAQTLLLLLCALLLYSIWKRISGNASAAKWAAALFLVNPSTAAYAQWLWPEVLHLTLVLLVFWLLLTRSSRIAAFGAGVCAGLALLTKSLLAAFWPVFLLAFAQRRRPWLRVSAAAAFLLGIGLTTAPTLIDGWRQWGSPMIADSSMYNLWIGLTDNWRSDYVEDMGGMTFPAYMASGETPAQRHAVYARRVRGLIAEHGVLNVLGEQLGRQYFRLFNAKTPLLSQLPGPACAGYMGAYQTAPWLTATLTWMSNMMHALTLVACAFGVALWRRRPDIGLILIAAFALYQLALLLPLHVKARFLFPLLPVMCGFAGSFIATVYARFAVARDDNGVAPMRWYRDVATKANSARVVAGAALALLLLGLAFLPATLDHLCGA